MMHTFSEHPGLYFVVATLLPLASFAFLFLAGGLRLALRRYVSTSSTAANLYRMLGGDVPGKGAAFVATGAIALAFVLSVWGGYRYFKDAAKAHAAHAAANSKDSNDHKHTEGEEKHDHKHVEAATDAFEHRWSGSVTWAQLDRGDKPATRLTLGYHVDGLTVIMFLMVTLIASLIHLFSIGYMGDELQQTVEDHQVHTTHGHLHRRGRFGRFFLFLSLFCFSMLNLVLADNFFQVFISWELVGICSYLLIGFYYERQTASNAANKAFITNRIGDAGFILGMLILWTSVGTFNFQEIFQQIRAPYQDAHHESLDMAGQVVRADIISNREGEANLCISANGSEVVLFLPDPHLHAKDIQPGEELTAKERTNPEEYDFGHMPYWLLVAAGLGIFLGCVGKSAQFPLHVWLPDAMEGPTPVSALIHAATMVAAGVYLVGRCFPLFTPESRLVIAYTGGITLFVAATIAIVMTDIKKVLAYSTVSQLGYMMLALGIGGWVAGLLHLLTHAFFKALLFLGSGSVIYGCHHEQDMRKMGGLYPKMKVTALTMLAGVLAIAGTPFFSGWYSKDAIVAQAFGFASLHKEHVLLFLLPLLTAGITTFYMLRMWFMTFTGEPQDHHVHEHAHESPRVMTVPLIVLAFFSVCVAWGWPLYDAHKSVIGQTLHHAQPHTVYADFGFENLDEAEAVHWRGGTTDITNSERHVAGEYHFLAGNLALLAAGVGALFAVLLYYLRAFDPAEAKEQFPRLHRFLYHKWYFDELYSAILVRPALAVAGWCRSFDLRAIDGLIDASARWAIRVSNYSGWTDLRIVDGLVNLIARVTYGFGDRLRTAQTGYIRSYVLFLVLAVIGIFALLTYFVTMVAAR